VKKKTAKSPAQTKGEAPKSPEAEPLATSWAGKTPTPDQWRELLEKHARWSRGDGGGQRANLQSAYLQRAYLQGAYLQGAYLQGAYLRGADLQGAKDADLTIARTRILAEGDLIGWKKCRSGVIVQLLIPLAARRSHAFGRKCRAEAAVVMATFPPNTRAESLHAEGFCYEQGQTVRPDKWDEDWTNECGGGIHFYITRAEAEAHA